MPQRPPPPRTPPPTNALRPPRRSVTHAANGRDYLAEVCREWEKAAEAADTRVVVLRTGIVLAKDGGALGRMIPVFQIFAGGPLGSGRQWMSWIHR